MVWIISTRIFRGVVFGSITVIVSELRYLCQPSDFMLLLYPEKDPWFSGRTFASHAKGPPFESGRIHLEAITRMNVLFFTRLFYPHIGGVETHVQRLSQQLIARGHRVVIVTESFDNLPGKTTYKGIEIFRIPISEGKRKKFQVWRWLWRHKYLIEIANIIHAHDVGFWYFPFRFLYPFKKFFITFHGYETKCPPEKKAIRVRKLSAFLSNGVIHIGDYIRKWYGTKADITMYGAVEEARGVVSETPKDLRIVFIGRIEEDTGISVYAQVLWLLKQQHIKFHFEAVGDGSLRELLIPFGVVFGFVFRPEIHIAGSSVVFASSYLSILLGLFYRKKVIAVFTNPLKKDYLSRAPFADWILISNDPLEVIKFIQKNNKKNTEVAHRWVLRQTWGKVANLYEKLWQK